MKKAPVSVRVFAFLLLLVLMSLLLVPLGSSTGEETSEGHWFNLIHVPLFAIVTILLRILQTSLPARWGSLWLCAMLSFLLGVLSELAQSITGRNCSMLDVISNLSGILMASALLLRGSEPNQSRLRWISLLLGFGAIAFPLHPLVKDIIATRARLEVFPKLIDLRKANGLWQPQGSTRLKLLEKAGSEGGVALQVSMPEGSYQGLRYVFAKGIDAAGYTRLMIEIENPGEVFELGVRMDFDGQHRQYTSVWVPKGRSRFLADRNEDVGSGRLLRVVLFTGEEQPARSFQLLDVGLSRKSSERLPAGS